MNNKISKKTLAGILLGVTTGSFSTEAFASKNVNSEFLGSGSSLRSFLIRENLSQKLDGSSQLLAANFNFSTELKGAEGKCGEGKCGEKDKDGGEGKCGEGKCGEKDKDGGEGKCGEGKCGEKS